MSMGNCKRNILYRFCGENYKKIVMNNRFSTPDTQLSFFYKKY